MKVIEKVLAFVLDGSVQRVMRLDEETAAIMLSHPTVVDITNVQVTESWNYDANKGFYIEIDGSELVVPT
jgi:hypothetical protein